ncbi:MAG: hypothetical protein ACFFEN_00170 [Candidatus Thorarchaeota archaeon]
MESSQFQALTKSLKSQNISEFISRVDKFTENNPSSIVDSKNYEKFKSNLERTYYSALSKLLRSSRFNEFSQLFNYSDKLGIFIDVSNIDVYKIISKLHVGGLGVDVSRIIRLVGFFNKYNLFERNLTKEELEVVKEIKEEDPLLAINLKDLFGSFSDSLIYYVCKVMPNDYLIWLSSPEREYVRDPNFLKNWTDGFTIYGLSVRNLGKVEDFIKKVETRQNSETSNKDTITLEFSPRYVFINTFNGERLSRLYREIHLVYPENVLKNKENILNKNHYKFYSLSMVIYGGLGPEGYGFTYSTPRGEIIEICSDQRETEAIIIRFKQYLKRKFLVTLEKEMNRIGVTSKLRENVINYLSLKLHPKNLISYQDKEQILHEIYTFLYKIDEFKQDHKSELSEIINKIAKAVSIILRDIKLEDQFKTRMDLVASGKLKSEDIAKLTSLRGKSHYDVLRERMFLQNKPKWFFKDYSEEIKELEREYRRLAERDWWR